MLAFLSDRSGRNQIHVMYADGGESWQATDAPNGASEIAWSPDSTSLAYVSAVAPDDTPAKSDVKVITSLLYRMDGEGFFTDSRRQVHIVAAHGGKSRMVTEGDWHSAQPAFSSDDISYCMMTPPVLRERVSTSGNSDRMPTIKSSSGSFT